MRQLLAWLLYVLADRRSVLLSCKDNNSILRSTSLDSVSVIIYGI